MDRGGKRVGAGRPKKSDRCDCGRFTAATAIKLYHRCGHPLESLRGQSIDQYFWGEPNLPNMLDQFTSEERERYQFLLAKYGSLLASGEVIYE